MKIIVISDVHGTKTWERILKQEKTWNKVVFLGDYFDPYKDIPLNEMIDNFKQILKVKNSIHLIGNHELHYVDCKQPCSRYNIKTYQKTHELILNANLLPWYVYNDIIFSHAGISKTWFYDIASLKSLDDKPDFKSLLYQESHHDWHGTGNSKINGPCWIRPESLVKDKVNKKYRQIVGHTKVKKVHEYSNIWFTDNHDGYVIIKDEKIIIKKLN